MDSDNKQMNIFVYFGVGRQRSYVRNFMSLQGFQILWLWLYLSCDTERGTGPGVTMGMADWHTTHILCVNESQQQASPPNKNTSEDGETFIPYILHYDMYRGSPSM